MKLRVATCQFPVSGVIEHNVAFVLRLMRETKDRGADVAHFPECALSGYAGGDIASNDAIDWARLELAIREILDLAGMLGLWTLLGSAHRLSPPHKPHNSLYFVDDRGRIVERYDKRFLSGDASREWGDLAHYSPGRHFSVVDIKGVRCGGLICVDCRYPELFRAYKQRGVEVIFHSFNAAHVRDGDWARIEAEVGLENHALNAATTYPGILHPATIQAAAGNNHLWISCPNSAAYRSCWPSFFVRPDGVITGRLGLHETGALVSEVDTEAKYYDSTGPWRRRAMDGVLYSGDVVDDARSEERRSL